ncbi:MAG TPA: hypothetical protein VHA37_07645 [Candidatus Saccharimonadales bacterium]|nr:hypothetical protein [Candidatus Saccharimonadales bacterium]
MGNEEEIPWEGRRIDEAYKFASRCKELRDSNPYDRPALEQIMVDVMTELWDRGFSQSEIKAAFERALNELPKYAAGEERRGG